MAGETVRPVANYPDDYTTQSITIPITGATAGATKRFVLATFDSDIVLDSAWIVVPSTTTIGIALGTDVTVQLFKADATEKTSTLTLAAGNKVSEPLQIGSGTGTTATPQKNFVLYPTSSTPTNNQITAGHSLSIEHIASAGIGTNNVFAESLTVGIRFRTKRTFVGGSDAMRKTA